MYLLQQGAPGESRSDPENAVYRFLARLSIPFFRIDHEPVHTMEDCQAIDRALGGEICKNLFLCNTQKTRFYLLMIREDKSFITRDVSRQLGVSRLTFGPPEEMEKLLHLSPGAVSPMGLLFESARDVQLIIDEDIKKADQLGCHPCVNTASIRLAMDDFFNRFLPAAGHAPVFVNIPEQS